MLFRSDFGPNMSNDILNEMQLLHTQPRWQVVGHENDEAVKTPPRL